MISGSCLCLSNRRADAFFVGLVGRTFAGPNHFISEWANFGEYIMPRMYRHLRAGSRTQTLSAEELEEVRLRCRLLRMLPKAKAEAAAHAMAVALEEIIAEQKPTHYLSRMVDRYSNDLLDRLCRKHGIMVVTFVQGAFPTLTRLTSRGEFNFVREPGEDEVDALYNKLSDPTQVVTYAIKKSNFTPSFYYKRLATRYAKHLYLSGMRMIKRDPLNYQWLYWSLPMDATGDPFGYGVVKSFHTDWRDRMAAWKGLSLAVPLPHIPEATTDYWIQNLDFVDYCELMIRLVQSNPEVQFVIKEHWSGTGLKPRSFFERLAKLPNAVIVPPDDATLRELLPKTTALFSGEGTAGLEAIVAGTPVVFYDEPSFYLESPLGVICPTTEPLLNLKPILENLKPGKDEAFARACCRKALSSTFKGSTRYTVDADRPENLDLFSKGLIDYLSNGGTGS